MSSPQRLRASSLCMQAFAVVAAVSLTLLVSVPASAETLIEALSRAIRTNPAVNARRASLLATRENLPIAEFGYLPKIEAGAEVGYRHERGDAGDGGSSFSLDGVPRSYGAQITQPLFDGFKTTYAVEQATSEAQAAQQTLRSTEQVTVFLAVQAYVDVMTARSLVERASNYISGLEQQLKRFQSLRRFKDATAADVAEIQVRVAKAEAQKSFADAALKAAIAEYQQVIGSEPSGLAAVEPVDALVPPTLKEAIEIGLFAKSGHPRRILGCGCSVAPDQDR